MQDIDDDFVTLFLPDLPDTFIKDIPEGKIAEIFELDAKGNYISQFEGGFAWQQDQFYAFVRLSWSRKFWDSTLGLALEMDLMRQIVEIQAYRFGNIENIDFQDDDEFCHLNYDILISEEVKTMQEALTYASEAVSKVDSAIDEIKIAVKHIIQEKLAAY